MKRRILIVATIFLLFPAMTLAVSVIDSVVTRTGSTPPPPVAAGPDTTIDEDDLTKLAPPELIVPIEGLEPFSEDIYAPGQTIEIPYVALYIQAAYRYGLLIASILAVAMIMVGGILYLTGGAMPQNIATGKTMIFGSLSGILLLMGSYMMLKIINPNLVNLRPIIIDMVKEVKLPPEKEFVEHAECNSVPNTLTEAGCLQTSFKSVGSGNWLQIPAADDFNLWMTEFKSLNGTSAAARSLKINYTFRSSARQECLFNKLGSKIAAPPCKSNHEIGLAIDLATNELTTDEYKSLIKTAESHHWQNLAYRGGAVDAIKDEDKETLTQGGQSKEVQKWKLKNEHWHFDYTGSGTTPRNTLCPTSLCSLR